MRILVIVPVKLPSSKLSNMINSIELTKSSNTDIVYISSGTVTEAINLGFNNQPDYDYYHISNDDTIYKTPLWDLKLAKKGKITHGTDCIEGGMNGQFLMIDGDIARAVGWLQLPALTRYGGDVVWRFIANRLDILEHVPEVIIEHHWEGADREINDRDMGVFADWLGSSQRDINSVKEALDGCK